MIAALVGAALLLPLSPSKLQVSTARGVTVIALRAEPGQGAMVPLAPLAKAVGGTVQREGEWAVFTSKAGRFRFLDGAPLVDDGSALHALPAVPRVRHDSAWVPLAFVAEVLADPARKTWNWIAGSAVLAEGPAPSTMLTTRPSRTTVGREERSRLPTGIKAGHRVTIDAGHGGTDPGNPGLYFPNGLKEKHITLAVALLVRDELESRGVKVTMTRTTDTLISLSHRAPRYCRDDCDLFVSLHVNALDRRAGYTSVRGFETYFLAEAQSADAARVAKMENDAVRFDPSDADEKAGSGLDFILKDLQNNEYQRESARAAALVQSSLREVHDGLNRGVKQANFAVLRTARRPAILVEMGYSTNRDDARQMTTRNGQDELASAIAEAVVKYLQQYDRKTSDAQRAGEP